MAREGVGVLLLGAPGCGKSDLAFRLIGRGFDLVADDQVVIQAGIARPPPSLAGLLEVRGLGIVRLPHVDSVHLALAVELGEADRLPSPRRHPDLGIPLIRLSPHPASAPEVIALALDCIQGRVTQLAGAFA